ncbi:hypothetical protein RRG08_025767 [Elysia crispata]|uniref:Uncharacterized protein n=1 Tax=Elysia crispata TaxID=231223 RepID=A0AAE1AGQ3_9GAST|nr:hypothetical protein RRG08_025767 [Elysia crispata]
MLGESDVSIAQLSDWPSRSERCKPILRALARRPDTAVWTHKNSFPTLFQGSHAQASQFPAVLALLKEVSSHIPTSSQFPLSHAHPSSLLVSLVSLQLLPSQSSAQGGTRLTPVTGIDPEI